MTTYPFKSVEVSLSFLLAGIGGTERNLDSYAAMYATELGVTSADVERYLDAHFEDEGDRDYARQAVYAWAARFEVPIDGLVDLGSPLPASELRSDVSEVTGYPDDDTIKVPLAEMFPGEVA